MSSSSYSRLGYMAIIKETTENTAVKPTTFIPILKEDIVPKYDLAISMPVAGNRVLNLTGVPNAIPAPTGKITVNVEPKTFGHFLEGVYGASLKGILLPITAASGYFTVGEVITGGTSAKTATVVAVSNEKDYLLVSAPSGAFTIGETLTGATSSKTATLGVYDATVYGHEFLAPATALPTYTVEFGYLNEAVRFTGVRFSEMIVNQKNNIITADINVIARAEFKHARVTAVTVDGAGTKTITVDQTTGLVVGDTIKLYKPSTGAFQDFSTTSVKTHTVASIVDENSFTVTNLQTATAVGDLIILAPQTSTYATVDPFTWVGGSRASLSDTNVLTALTATAENIEDFEIQLINEVESRHAANGANTVNRFPSSNYLKGLKGSGKLHKVYTDMNFLDRLRTNRSMGLQVKHTGVAIAATAMKYQLDFRAPKIIFDAFNPIIDTDGLLDQQIPYTLFNSATDGYFHKALLVTDIATAY